MGRKRNPDDIDLLVIHCSATPNGRWTTAEDIDRWHAERDFRRDMSISPYHAPQLKHIGYHFVIYTTGACAVGRPLRETGAHAYPKNSKSIGTCLIGADKFSREQWETLRKHVQGLTKQFPGLKVAGHHEIKPRKTCPGFNVQEWLSNGMNPVADHLLEPVLKPEGATP